MENQEAGWNFLNVCDQYPLIEFDGKKCKAFIIDSSVFENGTGFRARVDVGEVTILDKVYKNQGFALRKIKKMVSEIENS